MGNAIQPYVRDHSISKSTFCFCLPHTEIQSKGPGAIRADVGPVLEVNFGVIKITFGNPSLKKYIFIHVLVLECP